MLTLISGRTRMCVCVCAVIEKGMLGFNLHKQYLIKPSPDSILHGVKSLKHHLYISISIHYNAMSVQTVQPSILMTAKQLVDPVCMTLLAAG